MVLWCILTCIFLCSTQLCFGAEEQDRSADVYVPPVRRERVEVAVSAHGTLSRGAEDQHEAQEKGWTTSNGVEASAHEKVPRRELIADQAVLPFKTGIDHQQSSAASKSGGETGDQCAWWFGSFKADSCELRGLRRRDEHDTKTLCSAAERDRENCTGNFDAAGDGAWTLDGATAGSSQEKDASGSWRCMEDAKYNWIDYNDCTAALPGFPEQLSMTKACGINGHDGRRGSPRGPQICESQEGSSIQKTAACESLLAGNTYRGGAAAISTSCDEAPVLHSSPHVNTCFDYMEWLRLDRSADAVSLCEVFTGDAMTCFKVLGCRVFRQHDGQLVCGLVGSNQGVELDILDLESMKATEALAKVGVSATVQSQTARQGCKASCGGRSQR